MSERKIGAVVAAAGLSSRMGDFKPLLPFDGVTVIERCIANLRAAGASALLADTLDGLRPLPELTERIDATLADELPAALSDGASPSRYLNSIPAHVSAGRPSG